MINVHRRGVDAHGVKDLGHEMKDVSGVHHCVQAIVASQEITPVLLCEAMHKIEADQLYDFAHNS